jgi:hypothetical protein
LERERIWQFQDLQQGVFEILEETASALEFEQERVLDIFDLWENILGRGI